MIIRCLREALLGKLLTLKSASSIWKIHLKGLDRMENKKYAILKKDSPLLELFSDGRIPMKHGSQETGNRRQEDGSNFYGLDLAALGDEDITQLLANLKKMGINADIRDLENEGFNILKEHIIGVSFSDFKLF